MKRIYSTLTWWIIIAFTTNISAQDLNLQPTTNSVLLLNNPALSGLNFCPNVSATHLAHYSKNGYSNVSSLVSFDSYSDVLNGGIGVSLSQTSNNPSIYKTSFNVQYAYRVAISRNLSASIGLKSGYSFNTPQHHIPPTIKVINHRINTGLGGVMFTNRLLTGFALDNIARAPDLKVMNERLRNPTQYSAFVGYNISKTYFKSFMPLMQYEHRPHVTLTDSFPYLEAGANNRLTFQVIAIKSISRAGIGYQVQSFGGPKYYMHLGINTDAFIIVYNIGLSQTQQAESSKQFTSTHQVSVELNFPCKLKRRKFRSMQCPSFGSGPSHRSVPYTGQKSSYSGFQSDLKAGALTAGEVNDFAKWGLWQDMSKPALHQHQATWKLSPEVRHTFQVRSQSGHPIVDATITSYDESGNPIWVSKTDNTGKAKLWYNLYGDQKLKPTSAVVAYNNKETNVSSITPFEEGINCVKLDDPCEVPQNVDLLFAVDATGSMSDEIEFLKVELRDIIERCQEQDTSAKIRLGSLFYRCPESSYVTRMSGFDLDPNTSINFIGKQEASEGGLEAVETALDVAINDFEWSENAKSRILFLILDEAPGNDSKRLDTYRAALENASKKGIRVVPLVASGVGYGADKSLEYLMRSTALATNGTFTFFTNHSGIGNEHTNPETDEFDVEPMNSMILRIIRQFSHVNTCESPLDQQDISQGLSQTVEIIDHVILGPSQVNSTPPLSVTHTPEKSNQPVVIPLMETTTSEITPLALRQPTEIKSTFTLFPNPTAGIVNIKLDGEINELYVADINGKLLQRIRVNTGNTHQIDLSMYPQGIYFIQCLHNDKWKKGKVILSY